ncbi:uncharacterized protein [Lepeophtheirus salmonis]|uniref:uncharacterized protein isoform X2 n=1 Tax=Lepeophtheirus salmonis TaxID=72036 RepID=UPI003AF4014A
MDIQHKDDTSDDQADDGIGTSDDDENSVSEENSTLKTRMIIKPDPSLIGQLMNFDEEEEDEDEDDESEQSSDSVKSNKWQKTVAKDLLELSPRFLERRHSISLCMTPNRRKNSYSSTVSSDASNPTVSQQNSINDEENTYYTNESPSYENGGNLRTCELHLDEVAHIRSVLTKAELETLPMDNNIRSNVQRGKVCYVCLKTKFGLFYRGQKCDMCKQMVCANCYSKTRIPTDHFKSTPVFTLSPSIQGSWESYPSPCNNSFVSLPPTVNAGTRKITPPCFINKTVGSAPSSPESSRKGISTISETVGPSIANPRQKYATLPKNNGRRISSVEARELERERLEGHLLNICTDCKDMVLQVIRASSNRRVKQGLNVRA